MEETIVEVSIKNSPTGARMLVKPYPKDNDPPSMAIPPDLVTQLADWINQRHLGSGDLLFATRDGTPTSRNTFRSRGVATRRKASGIDFQVRVHDLRHAHTSWLLSGGSDIRSVMDRMGHAQITTTQKYLHTVPDADHKTSPPSTASATLPLSRHGTRPAKTRIATTLTAAWSATALGQHRPLTTPCASTIYFKCTKPPHPPRSRPVEPHRTRPDPQRWPGSPPEPTH